MGEAPAPCNAAKARRAEAMGAPGLVIFDCDGVLIDSEVIANRVLGEALLAHGFGTTFDEVVEIGLGKNETTLRLAIEAAFGRSLPEDFVPNMRADVMRAFDTELTAISGVRELLAALSTLFCVASNSHIDRVRHALRVTDLLRYFDTRIFTAAMVARGKPAPDLFLFAAERLGVPPARCLVVEDSVGGVVAAREAGMRTVGFCGGAHCRAGHRETLLAAGGELVFAKMTELREFLLPASDTGR
jgi:HAD superfamily hydrolase (TIGR01509 family)